MPQTALDTPNAQIVSEPFRLLSFTFCTIDQMQDVLGDHSSNGAHPDPNSPPVHNSITPPGARIISLHPALSDPQVGIDIVRVQPRGRPTLSRVVDEIELHPAPRSQSPFYWVIGDSNNSLDALDHVCVSLINQRFRQVTVENDSQIKKVRWFKEVLNCHVSRFDINPDNPLKVDRHAVEILLAPHGLITIDQNGRSDHLMALRNGIADGQESNSTHSCIGALAAKIVEEQLAHNESILDRLERNIDEWHRLTVKGPLLDEQVHEMLPTLTETLAFILRKVKQTDGVFLAMEEAGRNNPHIFAAEDPKSHLMNARSRCEHVTLHAESMLSKLRRVEGRHDRHMTSKGDKNIERFTFLLGISAPPMMADIACKMLLPDQHELHAPIALTSFIVGVGLVVAALLPDWLHERRMRHSQEASELGSLAHEIRSGRRTWLSDSYEMAERLVRTAVVEPGKRIVLWLSDHIGKS